MSLISIITPFYNAEKYLSEAIKSVINQTHTQWELILINDGSKDDSELIAREYACEDKRIRFFTQENKGVSSARNTGMKQMSGDYFCFLDADDFLPKNSLKARLQTLIELRLDCVDGSVSFFENDPNIAVKSYTPSYRGVPSSELVRLTGSCFFGPTWLLKNKHELIPFNEKVSHGEDLLFLIENFGSSEFGYTKEVVFHYRKGHVSAMSNLTGLENGYRTIHALLKGNPTIGAGDLRVMKWKVKKFMILDYIKKVDVKGVLRMICW